MRLGNVGKLSGGKTPQNTELCSNGKIPYFKVSDMNSIGNEIYMNNASTFLREEFNYDIFSKYSIIFPKNGGAVFTNKKRILTKDSLVDLNTGVFSLYCLDIFAYIFTFFKQIDFRKMYKGTALPTVDSERLRNFLVPVPPLSEQKRIVSKIEELGPFVEEYGKSEEELTKINWEIDNEAFSLWGDDFDVETKITDRRTDIVIENKVKHIQFIIDAKYYKDALVSSYQNEQILTYRTSHLNQVRGYILDSKFEGIKHGALIYPTVYNDKLEKGTVLPINGSHIIMKTINLNQDWKLIEADLINFAKKVVK